MPIYDDGRQRPASPPVSVRASVAVELEWVLHSAVRRDFSEDHPALRAMYERHPALQEQIVGLWAKDGQTGAAGFAELVLVAHHGGLLFGEDGTHLLQQLPGACATVPTSAKAFPMRAETDEDRDLVLHRLARLRRSAETRRHYVDVLGRAWNAASESWDRYGREVVAESVDARRAMLAKGAGWRDLSKPGYEPDAVERAETDLGPGGEIVVVPAYFAHFGLLFDLPGLLLIGVKAEDGTAPSRARSETLARRLRALSDPTRLAILETLRSGPKTVTELSARFGLAQPTVSNHVKLLRDNGIVKDVRDGTRRNLVVRHDVVAELMDELARMLGASQQTGGR
jgi:DNA-binding transcriptional ArsR family regulator